MKRLRSLDAISEMEWLMGGCINHEYTGEMRRNVLVAGTPSCASSSASEERTYAQRVKESRVERERRSKPLG